MIKFYLLSKVGIEGTGLEPTVESLFGENGFFPDTALKTIYFVSDKMPTMINDVVRKMLPPQKNSRLKRQVLNIIIRLLLLLLLRKYCPFRRMAK